MTLRLSCPFFHRSEMGGEGVKALGEIKGTLDFS
jgi:hypothetical protein